MSEAKHVNVTRTNYDRFESATGLVFDSADIERARRNGFSVAVTDKTPADAGKWTLLPLDPIGAAPATTLELVPFRMRPMANGRLKVALVGFVGTLYMDVPFFSVEQAEEYAAVRGWTFRKNLNG